MATKRDRESPTSDAAKLRRAETTRLRIQTSQIVEQLQKHVMGKADMTPTQVAAAQTLLKKVLPDMVAAKAELTMSPVQFNIQTAPAKK